MIWTMISRAVKFSYTWSLLFKDHSVNFLSTSQSLKEVDGPDDKKIKVLSVTPKCVVAAPRCPAGRDYALPGGTKH